MQTTQRSIYTVALANAGINYHNLFTNQEVGLSLVVFKDNSNKLHMTMFHNDGTFIGEMWLSDDVQNMIRGLPHNDVRTDYQILESALNAINVPFSISGDNNVMHVGDIHFDDHDAVLPLEEIQVLTQEDDEPF